MNARPSRQAIASPALRAISKPEDERRAFAARQIFGANTDPDGEPFPEALDEAMRAAELAVVAVSEARAKAATAWLASRNGPHAGRAAALSLAADDWRIPPAVLHAATWGRLQRRLIAALAQNHSQETV